MGMGSKLGGWLVLGGLLGSAASAQEINEHRPVFSPDGDRVVFMRQGPPTDGDWELFITHRSGDTPRRLTRSPGWDGYAVFSPDGQQLVFDRSVDGGTENKQPHVMQLESGEARPLGQYEGWLSVSDWSSDHGLLAFWERDGQRDLYLLDLEGSMVRRLTHTEARSEHDAHFSPDGDRIVFTSGPAQGEGPTALESMTNAGEDRTIHLESPGRIYGAAWAPDGMSISYTDAPDGENGDVYLLDLSTGGVERLTQDPAWDHMAVWDPKERRILFTSYRSGSERMYWFDLGSSSVKAWSIPWGAGTPNQGSRTPVNQRTTLKQN